MRRVRDWVMSIPLLIAFGFVLLTGEIIGRVTLRISLDRYDQSMAKLQRRLLRVFAIAGVRVEAEGRDRFPNDGAFIFISNHQSMYDIPIFGGVLERHHPRFVAKKSLAKGIPTVSLYLQRGGNALIDRHDRGQAMRAIAEMGEMCEERGVAAVIFPEGTRSRDGSLGTYKTAGARALIRSTNDVPIIPTAIDGSWKVFAHNMLPVPYGTRVRVRFGEPIARVPGEDADAIIERCRAFTAATLEEWHTGTAPAP